MLFMFMKTLIRGENRRVCTAIKTKQKSYVSKICRLIHNIAVKQLLYALLFSLKYFVLNLSAINQYWI